MAATPNAEIRVAHDIAGSGPAVLLLHGMGSSHREWSLTVPALAGRYTVISVDLPGFGETPVLTEPVFTGFADATAGLLRRLGLERVAVVGHSFGGMVSVDLADRHPDLVRQVVLVASAGMHSGAQRITWVWRLLRLIGPVVGPLLANRLTARAMLRLFATRTTPAMVSELAWSGRRARGLWRPVRSDYDFRAAVRRVAARVPLSLIWGDRDRIVPLADGQVMQQETGAELRVIAGVGHLPMYEDTAAFNRILGDVLARADGDSGASRQ
ncbi:MAG: alpha/beta fold hydrolase [Chloroflexota bacterium]